jgi:hypothetical protein
VSSNTGRAPVKLIPFGSRFALGRRLYVQSKSSSLEGVSRLGPALGPGRSAPGACGAGSAWQAQKVPSWYAEPGEWFGRFRSPMRGEALPEPLKE